VKRRTFNGVMPLSVPDSEVYRRLVSQTLIRSQPWMDRDRFQLLLGLVRGRNWPRLLEVVDSFPPAVAEGVERFYVWNQFVALVKKYPFTEEESKGFDPATAAWKKFLAAEHSCKRINQRFRAMRRHGYRHIDLLGRMREYIHKVLGDAPNLVPMYDLCDFGPGASVKVGGNLTNIGRKFLAPCWTVSPSALSYAIPSLWQHEQFRCLILGKEPVSYDYDSFRDHVLKKIAKVSHNKISFVPKSFKTLRSIATEPLLNGYLQKGIDSIMRRRLKAIAGIDLGDQSVNSEMARLGSLGGSNPYCTIDLSSASDSMSIELVRDLVPNDWFDLLDRTRSHRYEYRGTSQRYHKFVSMGNGFCFPLQTLIFASACHAVSVVCGSPPDFKVYGDDIVVRQSDALLLLELLRFIGFRNNPDKTFITGSFRESCGTDWLGGLDVRPAYLNFRLTSNIDLYKFHNTTLRGPLPYQLFDEVRVLLRSLCPSRVLFVRPFHGPPDSAFTVEKDVCMVSKNVWWDRKTWAWRWKEVLTRPLRDRLWGFDPISCNALEYLAVLRGSKASCPLSVRRKAKTSVRSRSYWGDLGSEPKIPEEPAPGVNPGS
jgi:hypothetical protein